MKKWFLAATVIVSIAATWVFFKPAAIQGSDVEVVSKLREVLSPVVSSEAETSAQTITPAVAKPELLPQTPEAKLPVEKSQQTGSAAAAGLNAWQIEQSTLSDEEYYRIVGFLKKDPEFLAAVMLEFQGETDGKRLKMLASLLSEVHDPSITTLAADMIASGNAASEKAAFTLLGKIQNHDSDARQIVLEAISTRTEEHTLVAAINAMANADRDISQEQKTEIINRISPLTQNENIAVRRHSYTMLFRWAADEDYLLPQLRTGLRDADPSIRRGTALNFAEFPQDDEATRLELFTMLNNPEEIKRNRKAAASALNRLTLVADEKAHIDAVLRQLRAP